MSIQGVLTIAQVRSAGVQKDSTREEALDFLEEWQAIESLIIDSPARCLSHKRLVTQILS